MEKFYNNHYIEIEPNGNIIRGFSDAFQQPNGHSILINDRGGYQFRLSPDGEENPPMHDGNGAPLYRWDVSLSTKAEPWRGIVKRTQAEIDADAPTPSPPMPTLEERVRACEETILGMTGGNAPTGFTAIQVQMGKVDMQSLPARVRKEVEKELTAYA